MDDSVILQASLRDPERFAELFDRHAAIVHRYVVRRLGPDDAEDVVAETFTTASAKRNRYAFEYPKALPWLYGITTNLIRAEKAPRSPGAYIATLAEAA